MGRALGPVGPLLFLKWKQQTEKQLESTCPWLVGCVCVSQTTKGKLVVPERQRGGKVVFSWGETER